MIVRAVTDAAGAVTTVSLKGAGTASVARQLDEATALARERRVVSTPALWLPTGQVLHGDAALDRIRIP